MEDSSQSMDRECFLRHNSPSNNGGWSKFRGYRGFRDPVGADDVVIPRGRIIPEKNEAGSYGNRRRRDCATTCVS